MENNFKHTPGPWKQSHRQIPGDPDGMYSTQVYCKKGKAICSLEWYPKPKEKFTSKSGKTLYFSGTYREANAKLIASAPCMLEALVSLRTYFEKDGVRTGGLYDIADHAIKKATE